MEVAAAVAACQMVSLEEIAEVEEMAAVVTAAEVTVEVTAAAATVVDMVVEMVVVAMVVMETAGGMEAAETAETAAAPKAARQRMRSTRDAHHFGPCRRCLRVHSTRPQAERTPVGSTGAGSHRKMPYLDRLRRPAPVLAPSWSIQPASD